MKLILHKEFKNQQLARWRKWNVYDIGKAMEGFKNEVWRGEATEGLENELRRRWSDAKVGEWGSVIHMLRFLNETFKGLQIWGLSDFEISILIVRILRL